MNWKKLFSRIPSLSAAEGRKLVDSRAPDDLQVLDVRQPGEYEAGHLPGARLIPLKELSERQGELNPQQPVLVYCAVGGRSRAAAQYLNGQGFKEVYNLAGGIKAWEGGQAAGPEDVGLELLPSGAEYDEAAALAFAMEEGLQRFYLNLAERSGDSSLRRLYQRLADLEDVHKERLSREYQEKTGRFLDDGGHQGVIEGGRIMAEFVADNPAAVLEQAMGLEFQAQDLYQRLAHQSEVADTRELFLGLAAEEKEHLAFLAREFEQARETRDDEG